MSKQKKVSKYLFDFFVGEDAGISVEGNTMTDAKNALDKYLKHPEETKFNHCVLIKTGDDVDIETVPQGSRPAGT